MDCDNDYLRFLNLRLVEVEFVFHLLSEVLFLLLRVVLQLNHFVDLVAYLPVRVLKLIRLVRQLIHVVEERIVLLLRLDKRSHDFINGRDSSRLLDLLEGVLDDLHVAEVLVHQTLFLAVRRDNLGEAKLEDGERVLELPVLGLWVLGRRC